MPALRNIGGGSGTRRLSAKLPPMLRTACRIGKAVAQESGGDVGGHRPLPKRTSEARDFRVPQIFSKVNYGTTRA
jgi:hypothetical protein